MEIWDLIEKINRLFPERQILYRVDGEVRFFPFSRNKQLAIVGAGLAVAGWLIYSAVGMIYLNVVVSAKEAEIAQFQDEYNKLSARAKAGNDKLSELANALNHHRDQLSNLTRQRSRLQVRLTSTQDKLQTVEQKAQAISQDKQQLGEKIAQLEDRVQAFARSEINSQASIREAEFALANTEEMVASVFAEREELVTENRRLNGEVAALNLKIRHLHDEQVAILTRIKERTERTISGMEKAVKISGLNLTKLIERTSINRKDERVGGPYVQFDLPGVLLDINHENDFHRYPSLPEQLENRLTHWALMNKIISQLPLAQPVDRHPITSKFGPRRDPFKRTWATHSGIDFGAPMRTPVYATGAGKVVYADWKGPYGRTVDIDHGNGIKTRYSHLRKIHVKVGDIVKPRQRVGLVGSSGRSTGAHLHYEVQRNGKAIDPYRFLKAGRHVFKK